MKKTIEILHDKKRSGHPIVMATAYDYPTALIQDEAGVDSVLVGDSVGTNMLGYASEQQVTMADMVHHTGAVARAVKAAYILADLPYGSCDTVPAALDNAQRLREAGADCVKLEGWLEKADIVSQLSAKGFAVCAHIGYNPQIHGKPRTFGRNAAQAVELVKSAYALEQAGAVMIVLEKVPGELAALISSRLRIPTIGIGSGNGCDGQVLVINDLLGMSPRGFKHAKRYMEFYQDALGAFRAYGNEVEKRIFPGPENTWNMEPGEFEKVRQQLIG